MAVQVHTWLEEVEKILLGTSTTGDNHLNTEGLVQSSERFDFHNVPNTASHKAFRVIVVLSDSEGPGSSFTLHTFSTLEVWVLWKWRDDDSSEHVSIRNFYKLLDRIEKAIITDRSNTVFDDVIFKEPKQEISEVAEHWYIGRVAFEVEFEKDLVNVAS